MPDPRSTTPRHRQVTRHTTATPVPPGAAGAVNRAASALARQDALTRTPTLPRDPGNEHPPMPDPPTGGHSIKELAADDTKPASGTGQPDEDDDKDERSRKLRRAEDDSDQDANAKADDGGAAKDPDPDDEKPSDAKG
jgi:hypothetical protein